jgi:type II secretory pathway pseudopilin PulG
MRRAAFSPVELVVVLAIIGLLLALTLPAVQKVRAAVARTQCANNLRQIGLALHQYHDTQHAFPPAVVLDSPGQPYNDLSWRVRIMPFLEQEAFWNEVQQEYRVNPNPGLPPYHAAAGKPFAVFSCPADWRVDFPHPYGPIPQIAMSSYLGVEGINYQTADGIFYKNSWVRMAQVTDGLSTTLLVGERPPSNNYRYGWLYFGIGQGFTGSLDHCLGVREIARESTGCAPGPYHLCRSNWVRLAPSCTFGACTMAVATS